jgi:hypothetical protein
LNVPAAPGGQNQKGWKQVRSHGAVACAEIVPNAYRHVERRIERAREMKKGSTDPEVTHVVPLRSECDDVDFCGFRSFLMIVAR